MTAKDSMTMAREARVRRIAQIEDELARPSSEGVEWHIQRGRLERELERLRKVQAYVKPKDST